MFAASKTASTPTGGYQISRSLRFNEPDTTYLNRTPASTGNRRTYTFSTWIKRSKTGTDSDTIVASMPSGGQFRIFFQTSSPTDTLRLFSFDGTFQFQLVTTQVFRDFSAWGHLVVSVDTTQATAANRVRVYWNGVEITAFSTTTYPSQNADLQFNQSGQQHSIGNTYSGSASGMYNGYITEFYFVDGTQLTPSSFGQTDAQTGVWQPKAYSGSYGTNGFYLNFVNNSNTTAATLGADYSGNGNNWTPNNFSVTAGAGNDSLVDSPTSYGIDTGVGGEVRGNYATLNPLDYSLQATTTFSNGNLDTSIPYDIGYTNAQSTFSVSSGKWYCEITPTNINGAMIGICDASLNTKTQKNWSNAYWWGYFLNGNKYNNNTASAYGASFTTNDVIGIALDMDTGAVTFYKNGTSQGVAFNTNISGKTIQISLNNGSGGAAQTYTVNFGQRAFSYTAPSGYKALCTQNLPTPTIGATTATQAGKYYNAVLYTGNGSARSITGVGFQPDLTWIKLRDTNSSNGLFDAVRGATKRLVSDTTAAEDTISGVTSFDSDGFSLGTSYNGSSFLYVAWNWKANGAGSSNTAGSITSTVSANTTSGFSVVTYTGTGANATVGHGLGVAPSMIIVKSRSATGGWAVYHKSLGATKFMELNSTGAVGTSTIPWNDTEPTSTVFTIGTWTGTNASGVTLVAYCFAEVAGYSKFGSYTGNGSTDGPFVFTGMRPAYIMVKRTDTGGANMNWIIWDATRNTTNVVGEELYANLSDAGTTYTDLDFLSNGFKIRNSTTWYNASGGTYIYACFASAPLKFSLAR